MNTPDRPDLRGTRDFPRDVLPDSTIPFLRDPYRYISRRCSKLGTDVFETRLLLEKTICMTGNEAAELLYDPSRFERAGAAPEPARKTLFGEGGVQGLDGEPHRHRKQMFMSLMTRESIGRLTELTRELLRSYASRWQSMDRVVLYDEAREVLTRAVCQWAGVPLVEAEVKRRTVELSAMFEFAGVVGIKHLQSRLARRNAERWAMDLIERVRRGELMPPEASASRVIAMHRDVDDRLLPARIAAVELLNVLRPTVAVSVWLVFAALALHSYRRCRDRLEAEGENYAELFSQEVRRFYPFFPAVLARVKDDFTWNGYGFVRGRRVVLDLYGTDHDPRDWEAPEEFRPERFGGEIHPYAFIPQGGGDANTNHRCPGEPVAVELMKATATFLVKEVEFDVPEQDLRVDFSRLPALPRSRFVIRNVRLRRNVP